LPRASKPSALVLLGARRTGCFWSDSDDSGGDGTDGKIADVSFSCTRSSPLRQKDELQRTCANSRRVLASLSATLNCRRSRYVLSGEPLFGADRVSLDPRSPRATWFARPSIRPCRRACTTPTMQAPAAVDAARAECPRCSRVDRHHPARLPAGTRHDRAHGVREPGGEPIC
jgi:hypothetical protein